MSGSACSAACGWCGRCTAEWDDDDREWYACLWCNVRVYDDTEESEHYPYCSNDCSVRAETCERDPRRI